jgi:acyl carrier protein
MKTVTLENLLEIFEEIIDISGIQPMPSMVLGADIPINSMEMLRIFSRIESRYRFRFSPKDVMQMRTVGDLLETVRRYAT